MRGSKEEMAAKHSRLAYLLGRATTTAAARHVPTHRSILSWPARWLSRGYFCTPVAHGHRMPAPPGKSEGGQRRGRSDGRIRQGKRGKSEHIQLNKQILECSSAGALCDLIEARGRDFNAVNVATAYRKLLLGSQAGCPADAMTRQVKRA